MACTSDKLMVRYRLSGDICSEQVSERHIGEISGFLGERWRKLPPNLDLEEAVLNDLERDFKTEEEKRTSLLKKWKEEKGFEATYEVLIKALLHINCRGVAERVCKLLEPQKATSGNAVSSASGKHHGLRTGTGTPIRLPEIGPSVSGLAIPPSHLPKITAASATHPSKADGDDSEPDLSPEIHNDLKQQLKHNYKTIRFQYSSYINCIRTSLEKKGVTVKNLSFYLLTLPAFDCTCDIDDEDEDFKLMSQRKEEVEGAGDITDIIKIINSEYASFLEYDIFQGIVEEYKLDQNLEPLQYPEHLKAYIQMHKLSEFVERNPALEKYSSAKELILKFDIKLSACKLATLLDLKNSIASILGLKPSALRLLTVREGCLVVKFLIPEFIAKKIFTEDKRFTLKEAQDFQHLSLLWLKCGNFEFPFRLLTDTTITGTMEVMETFIRSSAKEEQGCSNQEKALTERVKQLEVEKGKLKRLLKEEKRITSELEQECQALWMQNSDLVKRKQKKKEKRPHQWEKNPQSLEDRNKIPAKVNQGVLGVEADTSLMKKRDSSRELEEQRDEKFPHGTASSKAPARARMISQLPASSPMAGRQMLTITYKESKKSPVKFTVMISEGDTLQAHSTVNQTTVVNVEYDNGICDTMAANSPIPFAILFDPFNNTKEAMKGYRYTISKLFQLPVLPPVLLSQNDYQGSTPECSVSANELLIVRHVVTRLGQPQLKVYSHTFKMKKVLYMACVGSFSTSPQDIGLYLSDILNHMPGIFPHRAVMLNARVNSFTARSLAYQFTEPRIVTLSIRTSGRSTLAEAAESKDNESSDALASDPPDLSQQPSTLRPLSPNQYWSDPPVPLQKPSRSSQHSGAPEGQMMKRSSYDLSPEVMKMHRTYLKAMNDSQILRLLETMGLEQYIPIFKENEINGYILSLCDEESLEDGLKVKSRRDRTQLLQVIEGMHSVRDVIKC